MSVICNLPFKYLSWLSLFTYNTLWLMKHHSHVSPNRNYFCHAPITTYHFKCEGYETFHIEKHIVKISKNNHHPNKFIQKIKYFILTLLMNKKKLLGFEVQLCICVCLFVCMYVYVYKFCTLKLNPNFATDFTLSFMVHLPWKPFILSGYLCFVCFNINILWKINNFSTIIF